MRFRRRALTAPVALGLLIASCVGRDSPTEAGGSTTLVGLALQPALIPSPANASALPIQRVRMVLARLSDGAVLVDQRVAVSPTAASWTLEVSVPLSEPSTEVILSVYLINVAGDGTESVQFSGLSAPLVLNARAGVTGVNVDIVRGPLANAFVTGIAITDYPDTLVVGGGGALSASATTSSSTPPTIFWTSLDPAVLTMADSLATALSGGTARVVASAGLRADTVSIVVVPAGTAGLQITAGNNQSGTAGSPVAINPSVRALDALGNPLANTQVTFAVTSGGGSVAGGVQNTDANGDATSGAWTLGQAAGANTLTATVTGLSPVVFTATANPGPAVSLVIVSGNNQTANAGNSLPQPLVIEARDQFANPVPNVAISWSASDGSLNPSSGTTGTNGRAQTTWTLGTTAVNQTATAAFGSIQSPTFAAIATFPTPTVVLSLGPPAIVGVGRTAALGITLSQPAPAGGVTVVVASANPSFVAVQAPGTADIAQGATTGQVTLVGVAAGTTNVNATATGYAAGVLAVTASLNIVSLPTTLNVPYGQTASIPVQLAMAAPTGGTVVTLTSTNPAAVTVVTPTVTVAQGTQLVNGTLSGVAPGTAAVIATATGYVADTAAVATTAALNVVETASTLDATFGSTITVRLESGGGQIAAPAPGVQVTLTPINSACVAVTSPRTIPTGLVNVTASLTYGGSATLPCTTRVRATAPNIDPDSLNVTVNPAPAVALAAVTSVGSGLQQSQSGSLGTSQHGGVMVRVTSSNPGVVLVSPNATTPGTAFIDIPIANGTASFTYYTQGVEGQTSSSDISATAPGFTAATPRSLTVVQPAVDLIFLGTSFTTLDVNDAFQVRVGIPNGTLTGMALEQTIRPGGVGVTGTIVNTNAAVATLVTTALTGQSGTVDVAAGQSRSPSTVATGGIELDIVGPGTTSVSATVPGFITLPTATVNVTASAPALTLNATTNVGSGLYQGQSGSLGASQHGGVTVRVTSSDPGVVLVSPNATTPGTSFIDIPIANGSANFTYYTQGVDGQTGTSDITATTPLFTSPAPRTVTVVQPAVDIIFLGTSFTTLDVNDAFQIRLGIPNAQLTAMALEQPIRPGGTAVTGTIVNGNAAVAELITTALTGQSGTVDIAAGQSRSPTTVATGGIELDIVGPGTTSVSATIPGFITLPTATVTLTASAPALTLSATTSVGSGLHQAQSGSLGASQHGGVIVRITSSDPGIVLVSPNATTTGTPFIDIPIANGSASFTYYTQGVEGQTGTSDITATTPLFTSPAPRSVTVVQPAVDVIFLGTSFTTLDSSDPFQVRVGIPNAQLTAMALEQTIRPGGVAVTSTIVNSNVTVAQLITTALTANSVQTSIGVGQARSPSTVATGGVEFDPLASGTTSVSATIPGFITLPTATVSNITVSAPALTLSATGDVGAGLQQSQSGSLNAGNHGALTVRLTSSNPSVLLLSPNATTAGTSFIDIPLTDNQTSFSYYTQGVEGASATASVNAVASGFTDGNVSATVRPPAIDIIFLTTPTTAAAVDDPFQVRTGWSSSGTSMSIEQAIRVGGVALDVTVANSNASAGQLVTTSGAAQTRTVQVVPGQARSPVSVATGGVAFDALAVGQTTVSIQTAPGFVILPSVVVTIN